MRSNLSGYVEGVLSWGDSELPKPWRHWIWKENVGCGSVASVVNPPRQSALRWEPLQACAAPTLMTIATLLCSAFSKFDPPPETGTPKSH